MKARLKHFKKEAEDKLSPLLVEGPLLKIRRNLHPPFLGEALQYIREFHKTHSANDYMVCRKHVKTRSTLS